MTTKKPGIKKTIEEVATSLFSLMGTKAKTEVLEDKENEAYVVRIDAGEEAGLLIGRRGETLLSIQTLFGIIVRQRLGEWVRVMVDVGDWREKEEERLTALAHSAAERAKETSQPQPLYNLSASQRRVVHLVLSKDSNVQTESLGEGEERYLVVKPKS